MTTTTIAPMMSRLWALFASWVEAQPEVGESSKLAITYHAPQRQRLSSSGGYLKVWVKDFSFAASMSDPGYVLIPVWVFHDGSFFIHPPKEDQVRAACGEGVLVIDVLRLVLEAKHIPEIVIKQQHPLLGGMLAK